VFQLAREQRQLAEWSGILQRAAAAVLDERVASLLSSPRATPERLTELIAGIASGSVPAALATLAHNLFATLANYRRLGLLPEIAAHFEQLRADAERTLDVTVTSAVPLSDAQREQFTRAMHKRLDREVRLHCELDPALIGGAVVRADDLVIDGSVRASLTQLAAAAAS
jgi:F-type H+-transporting ATPase subunit delta